MAPVLNFSKASRALIVPLTAIVILDLFLPPDLLAALPASQTTALRALATWWIALLADSFAVLCFLYFRVWHMVSLYELVDADSTFFFRSTGTFEVHATDQRLSKRPIS